jgi:hypothetical protein
VQKNFIPQMVGLPRHLLFNLILVLLCLPAIAQTGDQVLPTDSAGGTMIEDSTFPNHFADEFKGDANFLSCKFDSYFIERIFPEGQRSFFADSFRTAYISGSFPEPLSFNQDRFEKEMTCTPCKTNQVFVTSCQFGGNARFLLSGHLAEFRSSYFYRGISLHQSTIDTLIFKSCYFYDTLNLSHLQLHSNSYISLEDSHLPKILDLSNNEYLPNEIDLTLTAFPGNDSIKCKINLLHTDISKIKMDYLRFRLFIPDSVLADSIGRYKITHDDEIEALYESLLVNFKNRGQNESYQLLDVEYRNYRAFKHWYDLIPFWLNKAWWNFGYSKGRVFLWALFFLLIFWFINYFNLKNLNGQVYEMDNIVYTSTIFFRLTLKMEKLQYSNRKLTSYLILIYVLGVVCLAYMANFVLQKG